MARLESFRKIRTVGDLKAVLEAFPDDVEVQINFTPMNGDMTFAGQIDVNSIVHQEADSAGERFVVIDVQQTFGDKFHEFRTM
ncbi:MAG: hypothetical protein U1F55_11355 [Chitinivorax sp.]|jgi:predicted secreted protein